MIQRAESAKGSNGRSRTRWLCQCDCGKQKIIYAENLTQGKTLSCGCLQKETAKKIRTIHGGTDSRLYNVWCAMKRRCYNQNVPEYHRYGGRGISVCSDWLSDFESFRDWAIANGYDESAARGVCTIDRIDNNGNYTPENCRIVTQQEQMNNVSYNHIVEYDGDLYTVAQLSRLCGMSYEKLLQRLNRYDYSVEQAVTN